MLLLLVASSSNGVRERRIVRMDVLRPDAIEERYRSLTGDSRARAP